MGTFVLSIGNSGASGGIFSAGRLTARFRVPSEKLETERGFAAAFAGSRRRIRRAALCSVVPSLTARARRAVRRHFFVDPLVLTAASAHGLEIGYRKPRELGADRLAAALGSLALYPGRNAIVVDCGSATTITVVRAGELLGGAILPGAGLWAEVLAARTAQLPRIGGLAPTAAIGRSPREAITSGIYFGHAGAIRELVLRARKEAFSGRAALVIGTGGLAARFAKAGLFDVIEPNLVLHGLRAFAKRIWQPRVPVPN
jgi:type III pantothenate kinase